MAADIAHYLQETGEINKRKELYGAELTQCRQELAKTLDESESMQRREA